MQINKFISLVFGILVSGAAVAQEAAPVSGESSTKASSEAAEAKAAPKAKINLTGYYYNFEGTRGQKDGDYSFGDTTLRMDLLTLSYQLNPAWTLMLIGQRYENYVVTKTPGATYTDRTQGVGDTILSGMTMLSQNGSLMVFADVGVSLPTGSINNRVAGYPEFNYPYNMQMGSGTTDLVLGLTPMLFLKDATVMTRLSTFVRTGRNQNDYTLGNLYRLDASYDYNLGNGFTPRLVGYYKYKDAVKGEDKNRRRDASTEFYFHSQINWDVSAAMKYEKKFEGTNISIGGEIGVPVAQDSQNYDHVVVSTEYYGNLSLTGAF